MLANPSSSTAGALLWVSMVRRPACVPASLPTNSIRLVIQFAKLSGFSPIITTASKRNEVYLKSIGATDVIDRTLPLSDLPNNVKAITSKPIKVAYDAISLPETQKTVYDILASDGKLVIVLESVLGSEKDGKTVAQVSGNVHTPGQRKLGVSLYSKLTELLAAGDIKVGNCSMCEVAGQRIDLDCSQIMLKSFLTDLPVSRTAWRS